MHLWNMLLLNAELKVQSQYSSTKNLRTNQAQAHSKSIT